ncbi:4-amino-4-deoxy-L-arabinose-phosphoundecaprenol flippase subunit ArnF [compost metagenome]
MQNHIYIAAMILLTTYSQVVMRWRVGLAGALPSDVAGKVSFVAHLLISPWVLSGIFATFLAGVFWMMALSKFEISYAYPFTGLIYILVMLAGFFFFRDAVTFGKMVGTCLIIAGLVFIARS